MFKAINVTNLQLNENIKKISYKSILFFPFFLISRPQPSPNEFVSLKRTNWNSIMHLYFPGFVE